MEVAVGESRFQSRFAAISVPLLLIDAEEKVAAWSVGAEACLGHCAADALDCVLTELLPIDLSHYATAMEAARQEGVWLGACSA